MDADIDMVSGDIQPVKKQKNEHSPPDLSTTKADVQTWHKMHADIVMEIGDGRHDPESVSLTVYLPADVVSILRLVPCLSRSLLSDGQVNYCLIDGIAELLDILGVKQNAVNISNESILAYAALNIVVHSILNRGLPTGCDLRIEPCELGLNCGSDGRTIEQTLCILSSLPSEQLQRMISMCDVDTLKNLSRLLQT